ncbi:MAG: hypothetical protein AAFO07_15800 [Bacteroidota bacterium]
MTPANLYLQSILQDIKKSPNLPSNGLLDSLLVSLQDKDQVILDKALELSIAKDVYPQASAAVCLQSIFANIDAKEMQCTDPEKTFFDQQSIGFNATFFPTATPKANDLSTNWKSDLGKISLSSVTDSEKGDRLLSLLFKYGSFLPSHYEADVSLYDHARIKAALAVCLANGEDFLLVHGGVSGIQKYLYDVIRRRAAKLLKGRSFYLKLLLDSVILRLITDLGIFRANVLYSSGGNFALLVPASLEDQLKELEDQIAINLFNEHQMSLSFEMAWSPLSQQQIKDEMLYQSWEQIGLMMTKKKAQPYLQSLIASAGINLTQPNTSGSGYQYFFTPQEVGGEVSATVKRDAISGDELRQGQFQPLEKEADNELFVSNLTTQQIQLARLLKDQKKLEAYISPSLHNNNNSSKNHLNAGKLGINWTISDRSSIIPDTQKFSLKLNEFILEESMADDESFQIELYGGNDSPKYTSGENKNDTKPYEDLIDEQDKVKKLGVLRMDVDDLGKTFTDAFDKRKYSNRTCTLSRYVSLSRQLDYFFKGYLNHIWSNNELYREHLLILYSGGDDLFIIGKWDVSIAFAQDIYTNLKKWVCHHPGINISGGIAMVNAKFPISKSADMAGEAEDLAKDYSYNGKATKNALTLFGIPLNWERDMPTVVHLKDELFQYTTKNIISKNILGRLMSLYQDRNLQQLEDAIPAWRWTTAYIIHKIAQPLNRTSSLEKNQAAIFLKSLSTGIFSNSFEGKKLESQHDFFTLVYVAARWAELCYRDKSKENE